MLKNKGLIIAAVCFLAMAFLVPAYAQTQSGILQQDRDQDCIPEGPATRAYGEPPTQAQEEKPEVSEEETLEEDTTTIQEQTQTQEQLKDCDCENEDCQQYQYQFQYQEKYRNGQKED